MDLPYRNFLAESSKLKPLNNVDGILFKPSGRWYAIKDSWILFIQNNNINQKRT